jgi:hypothetical protein
MAGIFAVLAKTQRKMLQSAHTHHEGLSPLLCFHPYILVPSTSLCYSRIMGHRAAEPPPNPCQSSRLSGKNIPITKSKTSQGHRVKSSRLRVTKRTSKEDGVYSMFITSIFERNNLSQNGMMQLSRSKRGRMHWSWERHGQRKRRQITMVCCHLLDAYYILRLV